MDNRWTIETCKQIGDLKYVTEWTVLNETCVFVYFAIFCRLVKNACQNPG